MRYDVVIIGSGFGRLHPELPAQGTSLRHRPALCGWSGRGTEAEPDLLTSGTDATALAPTRPGRLRQDNHRRRDVRLCRRIRPVCGSVGGSFPEGERGAGFVTVITLIYPDGGDVPVAAVKSGDVYVLTARGECRGSIAAEKRGEQGFGYDPVFIPDGYNNTFAEFGTDFKNTISHRAKAIAELERLLEQ